MALPEGYVERLVERLREEASRLHAEKRGRIETIHADAVRRLEAEYEAAIKRFAEKVRG